MTFFRSIQFGVPFSLVVAFGPRAWAQDEVVQAEEEQAQAEEAQAAPLDTEAAPQTDREAATAPPKASEGVETEQGENKARVVSREPTPRPGATNERAFTERAKKGGALGARDPKSRPTVQVGGTIQARYTAESSSSRWWETGGDPEYYLQGPDHETRFSIPRVSVRLYGQVYAPALTYKLQVDVRDGALELADAFVNYAVGKLFQIRVGKDRTPFSRQYITDDAHLQLVDRGESIAALGDSRDIGVLLHNGYSATSGFEYALGVYQGAYERTYDTIQWVPAVEDEFIDGEYVTEETTVLGDTMRAEPTFVLRVGYNNFPDDADTRVGDRRGGAYRESDLEGGSFRFGVNLSLLADANMNSTGDARARVGTDAIMKVAGWSLTTGTTIGYNQEGSEFASDRVFTDISFFSQSGYVIAGRVEPTLRLEGGLWQPSSYDLYSVANATAGLNVFLRGHDLKWASDFTFNRVGISDTDDVGVDVSAFRFRTQLQLVF